MVAAASACVCALLSSHIPPGSFSTLPLISPYRCAARSSTVKHRHIRQEELSRSRALQGRLVCERYFGASSLGEKQKDVTSIWGSVSCNTIFVFETCPTAWKCLLCCIVCVYREAAERAWCHVTRHFFIAHTVAFPFFHYLRSSTSPSFSLSLSPLCAFCGFVCCSAYLRCIDSLPVLYSYNFSSSPSIVNLSFLLRTYLTSPLV